MSLSSPYPGNVKYLVWLIDLARQEGDHVMPMFISFWDHDSPLLRLPTKRWMVIIRSGYCSCATLFILWLFSLYTYVCHTLFLAIWLGQLDSENWCIVVSLSKFERLFN